MPRKKRGSSRKVATPPHGKSRTDAEVLRIVDATEHAMLLRMGRESISRVLMDVAQAAEPIPLRTVDDYMRRVRERWEAEAKETRPEVKARASRRIHGWIRNAAGKGDLKAVATFEELLGKTDGTFAPVKIEASGPDGSPIAIKTVLTSDEKRARVASLLATAKSRAAGEHDPGRSD